MAARACLRNLTLLTFHAVEVVAMEEGDDMPASFYE